MGLNKTLLGSTVYLDTNIFIYALEGYVEYMDILAFLFSLIDKKKLLAVTSELTLAESLVKPMLDNNIALQQSYKQAIQPTESLEISPITRDILIDAAELRATYSVQLPDAIHLATALKNRCHLFLSNDHRLKNIPSLEIIGLKALSKLIS